MLGVSRSNLVKKLDESTLFIDLYSYQFLCSVFMFSNYLLTDFNHSYFVIAFVLFVCLDELCLIQIQTQVTLHVDSSNVVRQIESALLFMDPFCDHHKRIHPRGILLLYID